jgi:hypothetical protein
MLETTIAGSLPKPAWLATPRMLWAPWRLEGEALVEAKRDATVLTLKEQEDAGIDIVTDGEQSRQHFVHGFLERIDGVDFGRRVRMGIRNNRYEAEVPTVTGPLRRNGSVHAFEAALARAHTRRRLKFTLPGPMTIVDTIADAHYGDRVSLAMAFAALLNEEARELAAIGVDVIQFDEPAFNVYMKESDRAARSSRRQGCPARGNRRRNRACRNAGGGRGDDRTGAARGPARTHLSLHQLRHGPDGSARRDQQTACVERRRRARPRPVRLRKPVMRPGPLPQR